MTKKLNRIINITKTVLLALLLLGIAAGPTAATAVSGTNATAEAITSSAVANHSNAINISFITTNSTSGNWSVNITNPYSTSTVSLLASSWINISSTNLTPQLNVVSSNNTLLSTNKFNSNNGTIYVLLNTSNATDPNTFNVTFQNMDNTSENVTVTGLKFIAGPVTRVTITNISISAVANNSNNFAMNTSAFDAQNNPIRGATISLSSNRTQDTITPTSVTTNATTGAVALFNITSTLVGVANITGTSSSVIGSNTNGVVFISGPAAKLAIFGSDSVTGVTPINQTVAMQDAYGNNVTADRLATYNLQASIQSGSASITSTNPLILTNAHATNVSGTAVFPYNYTATYDLANFTITAGSVGAGAVTFQVTSNASITGISKTVTFYGSIYNLSVTTNETSMHANNGNDSVLVTVQLKDSSGNNVQTSGVTIQLGSLASSLFNNSDIAATNTTNANGITTFVVRSTTQSGSGVIGATVTVNPAGGTGQTGNSQTITLNQAPSLANSVVVNSTSGAIQTGSNSTITATILDYNSTGVAISPYSVRFNITTGDATFANNGATIYTATTASTGNATADITSTNASASNSISVNVTIVDENEVTKQVVGSLQNFTVTPGSPTQYSITPGTSAGLTNVPGTTQRFNITVKDSVNNMNLTADGTINITTDNQVLGNLSNGTTTGVLNNLIVTMTDGNASFNYTVNSTTAETAVLTLNSTSLGIVNTTVTITTSGATGITVSVNESVQDISSNVLASAQLTGPTGNLAINGTSISFSVRNAAGALQLTNTNATNSSGIATYTFNRTTAGVYTVYAANSTFSNSTTVTFAGSAASIVATANNTSPLVNATVTINATVKDSSGITSGSLDGGTITFLAGDVEFDTDTLSSGVASTTYTRATAGAVIITAFYNDTMLGTTTVTFTAAATGTAALVSSITPNSRNAQLGTPVTLFMSVINSGNATATSVSITQASSLAATVGYQQWDGTSFTGSANTPVDIAAGATANFVLTINATSAFDSSSMTFNVSGTNVAAASTSGVNTLTISANATASADVIMMSTGSLSYSAGVGNSTYFAVATTNVGGASATNVSFNVVVPSSITGLAYQVNQTNSTTGAIIGPATGLTIAVGDQPTFAVFLTPTQAITMDLANNRITLQLVDGTGKVIGAQSVAVYTT